MSLRRSLRRFVVATAAKADEAIDEIVYRPAVIKATAWLPRWWQCDLARLSRRLDQAWQVGWWEDSDVVPRGLCEVCGRRAAIHVCGGDGGPGPLGMRELATCGWCSLEGRIGDDTDLDGAIRDARKRSIAWRWTAGR